ncbi:MAG: undecaprenyl-diphosphatase UppP [Gemmataceae bacterium]
MPIWHAVILGIVQGLTEFLPISSTAHLIVVQRWLGRDQADLEKDPFTVAVQLGTLAAVFLYFRIDILRLILAFFEDLYENRIVTSATPEGRWVKFILVGTIPVVAAGLLFKKKLEAEFYNPTAIAIVTIVFALLMAIAEILAARRAKNTAPRTAEKLSWADALWVGAWQMLALMPGASRSGTTITAGLFAGIDRATAARYSFLLSLPSILGAGLYSLYKARHDLTDPVPLLVGMVVAGVVGYGSIAALMPFLRRYPMWVFVGYRLVLATFILYWFAAGG